MSRVLLTGASGFVGRATLAALVGAGHEVHAVARRPDAAVHPAVRWHASDLLAGPQVVAEVEPELLVHLAWYAEHKKFWDSPENDRWLDASLALLATFAEVGGRRAVLTGSCAEYEWSRDIYPESATLEPATPYGTAKRDLSVAAAALAEQVGMSLAWARLFFLYGPGEASGRFVPSMLGALSGGEPAAMTPGTQRRDFLHVHDAGAALAALADSPVEGPVNVASGQGSTLREIAQLIAALLDAEHLLRVGALPLPAHEPPSLIADVARLREEVGWTPRIDMRQGLRDLVAEWRQTTRG